MAAGPVRFLLRGMRRPVSWMDGPWRGIVVAAVVGAMGAFAVDGFRSLLFALESTFVGAQGGYLVAAARRLPPELRLFVPAIGGLAAGLLLWLAERRKRPGLPSHRGDYIEAVAIGQGRLNLRGGLVKVLASLLVVSTGGAVGREGAMVLLAAMLASATGRLFGRTVELRLVVSCGAAAGMAAAYHAPLAGSMFVAEILLGSLALAQLGPVIVAAVVSHGVTTWLVGRSMLFVLPPLLAPSAQQLLPMVLVGFVAAAAGAALLVWLDLARAFYTRRQWPLPLAFASGGLVVGALSLWRPEVWGNGYSSILQLLTAAPVWQTVALVLALKLVAIAATTGSGAPGGVFTPTLFVGAAFGALAAAAAQALGAPPALAPVYVLVGMATLLAATTHAPVMAALMVFEMTGQYALLAIVLPACVVAALLARRFHPRSVYGLGEVAASEPVSRLPRLS